MANPIGQSAQTTAFQEMSFHEILEEANNLLGIQNLANNFEEIHTRRKKNLRSKRKEDADFIVADVQGK